MKLSKEGIMEIASHEAIVRSPYYDAVGVLTIGIGHTVMAGGVDPHDLELSKKYEYDWLLSIFATDIKKFEQRVNDAVKVPVNQHQFDALVSFDYNTGGIYKANLTRLLNQNKIEAAGKAFMGWSRPKSIIKRRTKEMNLFLTGQYSNDGLILEYKTNGAGRIRWESAKKIDIRRFL